MAKNEGNHIDREYNNIVSFYDASRRHLDLCQKILPRYEKIESSILLNKSITLINNFVKPIASFYQEPIIRLLDVCEMTNLTRYVEMLKDSLNSIELLI